MQYFQQHGGEYLRRADAAGLHWPLSEDRSEEALYQRLFPRNGQEKLPKRELPDWEKIRKELKQKGVTLKVLWIEYHEKQPHGYRYA